MKVVVCVLSFFMMYYLHKYSCTHRGRIIWRDTGLANKYGIQAVFISKFRRLYCFHALHSGSEAKILKYS